MTIDERLDRLTQRHEALTQTAEMLVHMHQDNERFIREIFKKYDEAFERQDKLLARVVDSIDRLSQIAVLHDRRISGLEDERPQ